MPITRVLQRLSLAGLAAIIWICTWSVPARADGPSIIDIQVDENCNGTINGFLGLQLLPCAFSPDPGPGGLGSVMTYGLLNPPGLAGGDVVLTEVGDGVSDVIRFDPSVNGGSLFFYSENFDGVTALADIGLPGGLNTNVVFFDETSIGSLGAGLIYTPSAGQPGFVSGAAVPVRYTFISDAAAVPEPESVTLLATAAAGVALICFARSLRARQN